jgi:3-oxoacyl-[acyl-carrier protein] reductase
VTRETALITGVGRKTGLGVAIAQRLAASGYQLLLSHHPDDPDPPHIVSELRESGAQVEAVAFNLGDPDAPEALIDHAVRHLGHCRVLVNNAAYSTSCTLSQLNAEVLDAHYAVNLRATALLCKHFAAQYQDDGGGSGRIITMTSGQGLTPMPDELAYVATKGALDALTLSLSHAVAEKGITVNAVDPGATDTGWMTAEVKQRLLEQSPFSRLGTPEDAANLVHFLASTDSGWITGQVLRSRGGL